MNYNNKQIANDIMMLNDKDSHSCHIGARNYNIVGTHMHTSKHSNMHSLRKVWELDSMNN